MKRKLDQKEEEDVADDDWCLVPEDATVSAIRDRVEPFLGRSIAGVVGQYVYLPSGFAGSLLAADCQVTSRAIRWTTLQEKLQHEPDCFTPHEWLVVSEALAFGVHRFKFQLTREFIRQCKDCRGVCVCSVNGCTDPCHCLLVMIGVSHSATTGKWDRTEYGTSVTHGEAGVDVHGVSVDVALKDHLEQSPVDDSSPVGPKVRARYDWPTSVGIAVDCDRGMFTYDRCQGAKLIRAECIPIPGFRQGEPLFLRLYSWQPACCKIRASIELVAHHVKSGRVTPTTNRKPAKIQRQKP